MIKIKNTKKLLIVSVLVLLAAGAGGLYYSNHRNNQSANTNPNDGINYGTPTAQDKQDAENNKQTIDQREAQTKSDSSSTSKKSVTPLIVSYGQVGDNVKVSARVPGIFEDSGTCTLSLSKDGVKVSANKTAEPNVSEMSCGFISIARSKLSAGTWSAVVSYSSTKASGSSEAMDIKVN